MESDSHKIQTCQNCACVLVCTHNATVYKTLDAINVAIRHPADKVSDHYYDDDITRKLKALKEHALKITGDHCRHFVSRQKLRLV